MDKKTLIHDVYVDSIKMSEAVDKVISFTLGNKNHIIFTPNAEIMMQAQRDKELKSILNSSDMLVADGAGVILASKILGKNLPEKVSGIDLVKNTFEKTKGTKVSYFLFGGKPHAVESAYKNIISKYEGINIAGIRNGYFSPEEEQQIIDEINASGADILLVGLGAPKQEKWIYKNRSKLNVKVSIGVGGAIDVFAGTAKLAPEFLRRNGLEWLYRLYKEPWRAKRMMDLPRFVMLTLRRRFGM